MGADAGVRLRFGILSTEIELQQLSLSFIFFFPLLLFLFSFAHLDTRRARAVVFSPFGKFSFPTAQFFLRVETKQLYETNASGRPCPGKGRPPWDQRGRDREETLTRTKNRCTWSFRLHGSRARTSSSFVIKRRICARRATEFRPRVSPKSMYACRAYHSRARQYSRGKYTKWSLQENSGLSFPNKFDGANFSPAQVSTSCVIAESCKN